MTGILGAIIIIAAAFIWGRERANKEEEKLAILEGLLRFILYVKEEIVSFKTPLARIVEVFSDDALEKSGFSLFLKNHGVVGAEQVLFGKIPKEAYGELSLFLKNLGGGYSEGQSALCDVVYSRLERSRDELSLTLSNRIRMYRLLPVLLAASVVILLI